MQEKLKRRKTDKLTLTMQYDAVNGRIQAKRWGVPASTLARWRREGAIPDCRALQEPLDKAGRLAEEKLIKLVESGWLKARPLSRLIGTDNKVNALITARRHPNDYRYSVRHLNSGDMKKLIPVLDDLQRSVGQLLYLASITPSSNIIQVDLRALLRRNDINTANVRLGMDKQQEGRFWAFMRGRPSSRKDLDFVVSKLSILFTFLS